MVASPGVKSLASRNGFRYGLSLTCLLMVGKNESCTILSHLTSQPCRAGRTPARSALRWWSSRYRSRIPRSSLSWYPRAHGLVSRSQRGERATRPSALRRGTSSRRCAPRQITRRGSRTWQSRSLMPSLARAGLVCGSGYWARNLAGNHRRGGALDAARKDYSATTCEPVHRPRCEARERQSSPPLQSHSERRAGLDARALRRSFRRRTSQPCIPASLSSRCLPSVGAKPARVVGFRPGGCRSRGEGNAPRGERQWPTRWRRPSRRRSYATTPRHNVSLVR